MHLTGAQSTGWTMESFLRCAFGPLPLAHLAVDVDLARRCVGLLTGTSADNRRRLGVLAGQIQSQAQQHFLREEAELAGALAALLAARDFASSQVADVAAGFGELARRISARLVQMGKVLRRTA